MYCRNDLPFIAARNDSVILRWPCCMQDIHSVKNQRALNVVARQMNMQSREFRPQVLSRWWREIGRRSPQTPNGFQNSGEYGRIQASTSWEPSLSHMAKIWTKSGYSCCRQQSACFIQWILSSICKVSNIPQSEGDFRRRPSPSSTSRVLTLHVFPLWRDYWETWFCTSHWGSSSLQDEDK